NIDRGSQDSIYDRWKPRVPAGYQGWAFVGSMRPDRQALLTIELGHSSLLAADAMLSYLQSQPEEARDVLRHSHWYFCNHEEFAALGGHEPAEFRRRWLLDGLVIKAGPRGVTAYTELGSTHVPALPSQRVVDTTGAGDAIAAGMMAHWVAGGGGAGGIGRRGGPSIQDECTAHGEVAVGGAAITGGGMLPARFVIHAASMSLGGRTSGASLRSSMDATFRIARENSVRTIA